MLPAPILDRFTERGPAAVMVRASLERLLRPERLDRIFEDARPRPYTKQLLFSQVVAIMAAVATRVRRWVHAAYLDVKDRLGVSGTALYDELSLLELGVSEALVRQTSADAAQVIDAMPAAQSEVLPGFEVFFLDGNHLSSTEHRLAALRATREDPLPGQSLARRDAPRGRIVELVACEDGHAQERSMLPELVERIGGTTVIVADRNFGTGPFLFGLAGRGAYFVIRQYGAAWSGKLRGKRRRIGRLATGMVSEPGAELHCRGATLSVCRITLGLDRPTESGDTEIHVLTNWAAEQATAPQVALTYGARWTVEGAFQTLTDVLRCEVAAVGYPRAALFSFAVAALASNMYAMVQASLRAAHGTEGIEQKLSDYPLMSDVAATYVGMDIAVPEECWEPYRALPVSRFAKAITELAHRVKLARYPKKKRGPKKPQPRKKSGRRNHHISTARLLLKRRKKAP